MPLVAVTGAAGFVGGHLVRALGDRGWAVRALVRDPDRGGFPPGVRVGRLDLPDHVDRDALVGVDTLVHAAWSTREVDERRAADVNVGGLRRLLEAARSAGVGRVVFVSSVAAAADAPNAYGRLKHAAEGLLGERDLIVRPGTILARGGGGIFGLMRDLMRRVHVVPVFGGGRQPLQTVHVDDACEAIVRGIERDLSGALNVAEPDPLAFRDVLAATAERMGVRCVVLPLPFAPVLAVVRTIERLGLPSPLRSESLLGLKGLRCVPVADDLARLDLRVRPVTESLATIF